VSLKALQQSVLTNLAALLTPAATGLRQVHVDAPDSLAMLPCLVVFDEGFRPQRLNSWQKIEWRLRLQVFVQRGALAAALKQCRDLRGDLIDRLDTSLTLGLPDQVAADWDQDGLTLAQLEYPANSGQVYAGIDGTYVVWLSLRNTNFGV